MIKLCRFILLAVALCCVVGCASAGTQRGIGCWYGKDFHGKKTASGEIYNMHSMTAAHRKLPFNTWVRVKDLDSGREVVVRINNRGPLYADALLTSLTPPQKNWALSKRASRGLK